MRRFAIILGVLAGVGAITQAHADQFKSAHLLEWERDSQDFYIRTSVDMATIISGRNDKAQSKCVSDWFYSEEPARIEFIRDLMGQYPDYHPMGVIVATLEKQCGKMVY